MSFRVKGDASQEKLEQLAAHAQARSAAFDLVTGAPISVDVIAA